jgi:hypothetical protein
MILLKHQVGGEVLSDAERQRLYQFLDEDAAP